MTLCHATCLRLTSSNDQSLVPGMITSPFKMDEFWLSSWQAKNQLAEKSLSHIQTLGYHGKKCPEYVIRNLIFLIFYYSHSICTQAVKALVRPHDCEGSSGPSQVVCVISSKISIMAHARNHPFNSLPQSVVC